MRPSAMILLSAVLALAGLCPAAGADEDDDQKLSLKINADFMMRGEVRDERDFDSSTKDEKDFVGQRTRVKLSGKLYDARYVIQVFDGRVWGSERKSGTNESFALVQGYIEYGTSSIWRLGRQEITWGKKRFIGSTGWGFTDLAAYDGVRYLRDVGDHSLDAFAVMVAENNIAEADDVSLAGFSYEWKGSDVVDPVFYVLYKYAGDDQSSSADESTSMPMPGARGTVKAGDHVAFDYELLLQTGTRAGVDQNASYYHLGVTYEPPFADRFWVAVEYNFASGDDDPNDGENGTFDKLYGINHSHYGYIDYQDPQNLKNLRFSFGAKLTDTVKARIDYHIFDLAEATDRWYSRGAGVSLRDPTGAAGTDVGSELDLKLNVALPYDLKLEAGLSWFQIGSFVETLVGANATDSRWAYVMLKASF